jgi:rRNA maturation protein Nop10
MNDAHAPTPQPMCPECGGRITSGGHGTIVTAVGYRSPPGHNHDDNCRTREYVCERGHRFTLSRRNRCPVPLCAWVGRAECFCHSGAKVDEWPVLGEVGDDETGRRVRPRG